MVILKFSGIYIFPNCTKIIPIKRLKKENIKKERIILRIYIFNVVHVIKNFVIINFEIYIIQIIKR